MSSSGLHLKKKNVSSLVQKWQKVKKEVEIEERHREEREQAIRQKLEEWKQEYNWYVLLLHWSKVLKNVIKCNQSIYTLILRLGKPYQNNFYHRCI